MQQLSFRWYHAAAIMQEQSCSSFHLALNRQLLSCSSNHETDICNCYQVAVVIQELSSSSWRAVAIL
jgi:hypothetical protein